jgi:hypothetical protein
MSLIWTESGPFRRLAYDREADLEAAILRVKADLFGHTRIYLDVKRKIGAKGGLRNIPDGYLIDLTDRKPRLYVVENELAAHEPLRHIAVQILQFSLSFESEPRAVRSVLLDALQTAPEARAKCEEYVVRSGHRSLDHLLDALVYDSEFAALVIIDEMPDELERILAERFKFGVEVLELGQYENEYGERLYCFEPFLADVSADAASAAALPGRPALTTEQLDTVVVPARAEGFQEVFLGEDRWYKIRIHPTMRTQIRYIAVYQVAPLSAITHIAPVRSIDPWEDSGKYVVNFAEAARPIGPIPLAKPGRVSHLQGIRYTNHERLEEAKTLDDVW